VVVNMPLWVNIPITLSARALTGLASYVTETARQTQAARRQPATVLASS
jgi:hypothetical protein